MTNPVELGYALCLIGFGLVISFRLIVRGKNWLVPDWLNIPLLALATLAGVYGFYVLIGIL